jgi:hypothetical protein
MAQERTGPRTSWMFSQAFRPFKLFSDLQCCPSTEVIGCDLSTEKGYAVRGRTSPHAAAVKPSGDPGTNDVSAGHRGYCGQNRSCARVVAPGIGGNDWPYQAAASDPFVTGLRGTGAR